MTHGILPFTIIIYFDLHVVPDLVSVNPSSWASVSHPPSFFDYVFAFWHNEMFQDHLILSLTYFWNQLFSLRTLASSWVENSFLENKIWAQCLLNTFGMSQCHYIIYIHLHLLEIKFTLMPQCLQFQCNTVRFILAVHLSICRPFPKVRNPALIIHNIYIFDQSPSMQLISVSHSLFLFTDTVLISLKFCCAVPNLHCSLPILPSQPLPASMDILYPVWNLNPQVSGFPPTCSQMAALLTTVGFCHPNQIVLPYGCCPHPAWLLACCVRQLVHMNTLSSHSSADNACQALLDKSPLFYLQVLMPYSRTFHWMDDFLNSLGFDTQLWTVLLSRF